MPSLSTQRRLSDRENVRSPPSTSASSVGKPLGLADANLVRDRIRQWQEQGGGVVAGSDVGMEDAEELRFARKDDKERSAKHAAPRGTSRRGRMEDKAEIPRDRSKTPKKRVVSDEHWKKIRSPPLSAPATPRLGSRIDLEYTSSATPTREERRQKRREDRARERVGRVSRDGRDSSPPPTRTHSEVWGPSEEPPDTESGIDDRAPETLQSPSSSPKEGSGQRGKDHKSKRRRRSKEQVEKSERSPRSVPGALSEAHDSSVTRKSSLFSQVLDESKKIFAKAEPAPAPAPRVPSIEAWLQDTPDPFVDAEQAPVDAGPPLKTSSRRRRVTVEPTIPEDPNKIWEQLERPEAAQGRVHSSERRRRRRSRRSSAEGETTPKPTLPDKDSPKHRRSSPQTPPRSEEVTHDAQEAREASPSTLRRRGANGRAARAKGSSSPLKDLAAGADAFLETPDSRPKYAESSEASTPFPPYMRSCPPTGVHRLSTIASVETFQTRTGDREEGNAPSFGSESKDIVEPDWHHGGSNGLKRRLTTHADLMSVLSLPQTGTKSIRSARSIRTTRSKLATATMPDFLQELATDEAKYMRELRTLVDGVIPVLLSCVLSKSDAAVAAGLFRPSGSADDNLAFTKPIVDMGVALERLKTLHKRIPTHDHESLLSWAHGAQRVYAEYLRSWRLGFQDVIVNLAPAASDGRSDAQSDEEMSRDENGDIVDGDGEKVDVAFLLKRPLVRLKYLAKTFKGVNIVRPSAKAQEVATRYQELVDKARQRSNEERARLEDEAAAAIDPFRARDPRTMGVLTGVTIDKIRTVRARDYFNLTLHHSTGQRVDCKTELLLRDNAPTGAAGGDLLICEVDDSGRWLLFPPVETSRISACSGDISGEVIVMIRGLHANGDWHELLALRTDNEGTAHEWVQMLGSTPTPPKLVRSQSFIARHRKHSETNLGDKLSSIGESAASTKSRTPSPREIEVPLGEPSVVLPEDVSSPATARFRSDQNTSSRSDQWSEAALSSSTHDVPLASIDTSHWSAARLRRARAKHQARPDDSFPTAPSAESPPEERRPEIGLRKLSRSDVLSREWMSSPEPRKSASPEPEPTKSSELAEAHRAVPNRPGYHRAPSSTPTKDLPSIPKIRSSTQPSTPVTESPIYLSTSVPSSAAATTSQDTVKDTRPKSPASTPLTNSIRDQWSALTGWNKKGNLKEESRSSSKLQKSKGRKQSYPGMPFTEDIPTPPIQRSRSPSPAPSPVEPPAPAGSNAPAPPPHRTASPAQLHSSQVPILQAPSSPTSARRARYA